MKKLSQSSIGSLKADFVDEPVGAELIEEGIHATDGFDIASRLQNYDHGFLVLESQAKQRIVQFAEGAERPEIRAGLADLLRGTRLISPPGRESSGLPCAGRHRNRA
jgi:hypothetical protein